MQETIAETEDLRRVTRREDRYSARHLIWSRWDRLDAFSQSVVMKHNARRAGCGRHVRSADGVSVKVSTTDGVRTAGFSGVTSCGSVWACPVCSATIADARQNEIKAALTEWASRGGRVALVTTTMRHHKGQDLGELWDGLTAAKHAMLSGRGWQAEQRLYGSPMVREIKSGPRAGQLVTELRIPTISVVEVTYGANGWHVHLHTLLLLAATDLRGAGAALRGLGPGMFARWSGALVASGFAAPSLRRGIDLRVLRGDPAAALGEYFTKAVYSASMEVARGDMKDARHGGRTPFGILRSLVEVNATGDLGDRSVRRDSSAADEVVTDEALWSDFERASSGRKQIAWSVGLRAFLGLGVELTEQEIVDTDLEGDEIHPINGTVFAAVCRDRAGAEFLAAFEESARYGLALAHEYGTDGYSHRSRRRLLVS